MPTTPQTCYGGVRVQHSRCLPNLRRLDHGTLRMITRFHQHGTLIDTTHLSNFSLELQGRLETISDQIRALAGHDINPNSSQQVSQYL